MCLTPLSTFNSGCEVTPAQSLLFPSHSPSEQGLTTSHSIPFVTFPPPASGPLHLLGFFCQTGNLSSWMSDCLVPLWSLVIYSSITFSLNPFPTNPLTQPQIPTPASLHTAHPLTAPGGRGVDCQFPAVSPARTQAQVCSRCSVNACRMRESPGRLWIFFLLPG